MNSDGARHPNYRVSVIPDDWPGRARPDATIAKSEADEAASMIVRTLRALGVLSPTDLDQDHGNTGEDLNQYWDVDPRSGC